MIPCDSVKSESKDDKPIRPTPLKMYELLGIPKSGGKVKLQPERLKNLVASVDSKKPSKDEILSHRPRTRTLEPVKLSALFKSEGKINKPVESGRERLKPEKMKDLVKSWEKSQTVKPRARSQAAVVPFVSGARRKLYGKASPSRLEKTCIVERKSVHFSNGIEPLDQRSIEPKVSRKSCLPPPNSIRDKWVDLCKNERSSQESSDQERNDGICDIEETNSGRSCSDEGPDTTSGNSVNGKILGVIGDSEIPQEIKEKLELSANKRAKTVKFLSPEEIPANDENRETKLETDGQRKVNNLTEIQRPSVIVELCSREGKREEKNVPDVVGEASPFALSRLPLRELNKDSSRPKLDENDTSLEDLLGNSLLPNGRGESFYYENLPGKSFMEGPETKAFAKIERETLSWMHGNLKVAVQSAEEQLFSMRLVLKALEEAIKNHDDTLPTVAISTSSVEENISSPRKSTGVEKAEKKSAIDDNSIILEIEKKSDRANDEVDPDDENKENVCGKNDENGGKRSGEKSCRRSLRLASKNSEASSIDSFTKIEKELNIVHEEQTRKRKSINGKNDKSELRFDPRARKSIREYMALKSSMKFLQTPDSRGLPTPRGEKDTPSHRLATRRSLSRKLLSELDDLYADSPM